MHDKTGTLTENRMTIAELRCDDGGVFRVGGVGVPGQFNDLVRFGILASAQEPFDPMEKAFHALGREGTNGAAAPPDDLTLVRAYGLRPELLAVTHVWESGDEDGLLIAAKGAPEAIALLSGLGEDAVRRARASVDDMAKEGLRVLGVARARHAHPELPDAPHGFSFEFLGLVGLADPLRAGAGEAVAECRSAGIRVVMITGDYPATAGAIARQAGIDAAR